MHEAILRMLERYDLGTRDAAIHALREILQEATLLGDLLAGKLHAVLCRAWKSRVKGRDWYDFAWFAANHPSVNFPHLESRLRQSGHWSGETPLDMPSLLGLLETRIVQLDIEAVKREVRPFLRDARVLDVWSQDFFRAATVAGVTPARWCVASGVYMITPYQEGASRSAPTTSHLSPLPFPLSPFPFPDTFPPHQESPYIE